MVRALEVPVLAVAAHLRLGVGGGAAGELTADYPKSVGVEGIMKRIRLLIVLVGAVAVVSLAACTAPVPDVAELPAAPAGYEVRVFPLEIGSKGGSLSYQACYVPDHLSVPEDVIVPSGDWSCEEVRRPEILIGFAYEAAREECSTDSSSDACLYWFSLIPNAELP